jgi:hypothetical protein
VRFQQSTDPATKDAAKIHMRRSTGAGPTAAKLLTGRARTHTLDKYNLVAAELFLCLSV